MQRFMCVTVLIAAAATGCRTSTAATTSTPDPTSAVAAATRTVDVTALEYALRAPEEIPAGWTTFRLHNEGEETHFITLTLLPAERTYETYERRVMLPFNHAWTGLRDGRMDRDQAMQFLMDSIPAWFWTAEPMGGVGLIHAGGTAQATYNLQPGTYVMECYMKTSEGEFHAIEGMSRRLVVTPSADAGSPPTANVRMTLRNSGIEVQDVLPPGRHTVAVHFAEHPEMVKHDVHLVRLDAGTSAAEIVPWLDWMNVNGLRTPAPATFLGGTHEMPAGHTAYFTVDVGPGRYLWVSESTAQQGVLKEFTVR